MAEEKGVRVKRTRRQISGEEKLAAVKRVLLGREAVSKVCEDLKVQPSQLYQWQAQLFERGAKVFEQERRERIGYLEQIAVLEEKIARKDGVMAELLEEHVRLKKALGQD